MPLPGGYTVHKLGCKYHGGVALIAVLGAMQVSSRTKLLVLDGGGSRNAIQLARTLRSVGLPRAYVVEVTTLFSCSTLHSFLCL